MAPSSPPRSPGKGADATVLPCQVPLCPGAGGCSVRRGWPWAKDEGTWVYCQLAPLGCCLTEAALEQDSPGLDEVWASCRRQG